LRAAGADEVEWSLLATCGRLDSWWAMLAELANSRTAEIQAPKPHAAAWVSA